MSYNIKTLFAALAVVLSATSCLDKYPGSAIPEKDAMQTFSDAEQTLTGIYSTLKSGALYSGYLTLLPDIQADLVYAIEGYSNVYGDNWLWNIRATNKEIGGVYATLYAVIGQCNFFLDRIDQVIAAETVDENITYLEEYTGEVHCIRALAYSELLKCFCKPYKPETAAQELGVVLRTHYFTPERIKRASLYDSYRFVVDDLKMAEELLDEEDNANGSPFITKAAAQALRARVALYMEDWDTAIEYAGKLIDGDASKYFELSSVTTPYSNTTMFRYLWTYDAGTEVIWRVGFTPTSYGGALGTVFLNFPRDFTYYYPDYVPAQWVLNAYENGDLRAAAYFQTRQTGYPHQLAWPLLIKYEGNPTFSAQNIFHMSMPKPFRLAEQYLIRAEAYCRKGKYNEANKDITALHAARYSAGGSVSLNENNWLDYISDERVRELYMEGFRLHDLKRWGRGFERTPQSNSLSEGSSLKKAAGDPLFVWPIPQQEIEAPGSEVEPNESNK